MWGFFIIFGYMNDKIHPKRLNFFMKEIRNNYPETENTENYRFYYLYTDYEKEQEYLFVIVSEHALNREGKKLNQSLDLWCGLFGFTNATIMLEDDFQRVIETQVDILKKTIRGTKYCSMFIEVW